MRRTLTESDKAELYAKWFDRPITPAPQAIYDLLDKGPGASQDALPVHRRDEILKPGYLPMEQGWCMMPDGSAFVAGLAQMPGVTAEMLEWWFYCPVSSDTKVDPPDDTNIDPLVV